MSFLPKRVFILSAVRTPLGSFGGQFSTFSAVNLGAEATRGALRTAQVQPEWVDELFFGNVVSAGLGQAPARQVAAYAGLPSSVPSTTINKVCASGMKSIMIGAQSIALGMQSMVVTGGMENMSMIPHYLPEARWGKKYGSASLIDGLEHDGLRDAYDRIPMGNYADATAAKYGFSRSAQDEYAKMSYQRAASAWKQGMMGSEVISIDVPSRKGTLTVDEDEEYKRVNFDKIPILRPAFSSEGTVTAANASTINDGAAALVLASEEAVDAHGLLPIAEIVSFADAAQEAAWFTTTPPLAMKKALEKAKKSESDIEYWEVNEAFSAVAMAFIEDMKLDADRVNVFGGAVSLGHPLGASGARIMTTLINVLQKKNGEWGGAAICNGGGGASAMVVKRMT